jgi:hypothetical protein
MRAEDHRLRPWIAVAALFAAACASRSVPSTAPSAGLLEPVGGRYQLDVPPGWAREPKQEKEHQADLFIARDSGRSWLVARSTSGSTLRLAEIVANRRDALFERNKISEFREKRSYLRSGRHVPVSIARFRSGSDVVLVLIAVDRGLAVELLADIPVASRNERELIAMLQSLRFVEPDAR